MSKATSVLEIGTFTGFSALVFAEALPPNGTGIGYIRRNSFDMSVITLENNANMGEIAQRNFDGSPFREKISLRVDDAIVSLNKLADEGIIFCSRRFDD